VDLVVALVVRVFDECAVFVKLEHTLQCEHRAEQTGGEETPLHTVLELRLPVLLLVRLVLENKHEHHSQNASHHVTHEHYLDGERLDVRLLLQLHFYQLLHHH